jgi:hypothetical protein
VDWGGVIAQLGSGQKLALLGYELKPKRGESASQEMNPKKEARRDKPEEISKDISKETL